MKLGFRLYDLLFSPENIRDRWCKTLQAILDDRERPYYEHRWLLAA